MDSRKKVMMPSDEEDAAINAGIAADPDTYVPSDEQFAQMRPRSERKRVGRPAKENPKVPTNLRLDASVVDAFRATGDGWQTRINDVLVAYVKEHAL
jgi:uncharacterized protein (DUF4415 family)